MIRNHGLEARDQWDVDKGFTWFASIIKPLLVALGALGKGFVRSNKADTAIYAAAVWNWVQTREVEDTSFCGFEGIVVDAGESMSKFCKRSLCYVLLNFQDIFAQ